MKPLRTKPGTERSPDNGRQIPNTPDPEYLAVFGMTFIFSERAGKGEQAYLPLAFPVLFSRFTPPL